MQTSHKPAVGWTFLLASMLASPLSAVADDAATRIQALEQQLQALHQELAAMKQQLEADRTARPSEAAPAPAPAKKSARPVMAAFKDGITFMDDEGNWQMAINGRVQADYRWFRPDEDAADTFSLRRARLGATLTFYQDYLVRVEGEYAGGNTQLTYGYVEYQGLPKARVRIGQFKPLYGLERSMSTNFLDFQERSMADALLGGSYDRGIMVYGTPIRGTTYSLSYVNGSGTTDEPDARHDSKDASIRLTANLAELAGWKNSIVHFGGFYARGRQSAKSAIVPSQRTEGRGLSFFSSTQLAQPADLRRYGLDSILAYGPVKLQTEYIKTEFDGSGFDRDMSAWYANVTWNVSGESYADSYRNGVVGRLRPNRDFRVGGDGWGALQLGLRYSRFDASDFRSGNPAGTGVLLDNPAGTADGLLVATNEADAWTLGANWILNPNVRLVANWVHTRYDTPVLVRVNGRNYDLDYENALTLRAQFDF